MLCAKCMAVLPRLMSPVDLLGPSQESRTRTCPHHKSLYDLSISAEQGCSLCIFLCRLLELSKWYSAKDLLAGPKEPLWFKRIEPRILKYYYNIENHGLDAFLAWDMGKEEPFGEASSDFPALFAAPEVFEPRVSTTRPLKQDPADNHALITNWIRDCIRSHEACQIKASKEFLPRRLVDVGGGNHLGKVRLVITEDAKLEMRTRGSQYLALSYCWGNIADQFPTTKIPKLARSTIHAPPVSYVLTTSNLTTYQKGIPISTLPATIRDALLITKRLGLRYIWIDALCIIQDSLVDWEIESAQMGNIYARAHCTISASHASHANGGITFAQPPEKCLTVAIGQDDTAAIARLVRKSIASDVVAGEDSKDLKNGDSYGEELHIYALTPDWDKSIRLSPLNNRGWAFQEQHLSTRILYYTKDQVLWECRSLRASEQFPEGLSDAIELVRPRRIFDNSTGEEARLELISARWFFLVSDITGRKFTDPLDLLPALSGIAGEIEQLTGYHYVAGLWKENFL